MKNCKNILMAIMIAIVGIVLIGCEPDPIPKSKDSFDNVAILYSVGRNNLDNSMLINIDQLASSSYIPGLGDDNVILVVGQHYVVEGYDPSAEKYKYTFKGKLYDSSPVVVRLYKDSQTQMVVRDTVKRFPALSDSGYPNLLTEPGFMKEILTYVKDTFKSEKYGMVYSSHGSGWLPQGYYTSPSSYEKSGYSLPGRLNNVGAGLPEGAYEYVEPECDPDLPLLKSLGSQNFYYKGKAYTLEMDIRDFAKSFPMHMDYIVFDACLMGGIEVAYELKDVADFLVMSPAEVLGNGFDYFNMAHRFFGNDGLHARMIAEDFFEYYNKKTGSSQSATSTFVRTAELENLAGVCKPLFEKYRTQLNSLTSSKVQCYSRIDAGKHWFYDLEAMLLRAGINEDEQAELEKALDKAAPYKKSTNQILGTITVRIYSGFSMYLPGDNTDYLDTYYKTLAWNKATGLVD